MYVTGREFARQRGVDPSRVSQWKRQGRLVLDGDGRMIDAAASNERLNATLDQAKGMRRDGNITSSIPAAVVPTPGGQQYPLPDGAEKAAATPAPRDDKSYWADRAREQKAVASLAEMKMLREALALTSTAGVKKAAAETARQLRNMMLAIPDRIAPVLDPGNPARAHKLMTDEIQKALREFSSELEQRAAAAAGVDERGPALL